MAIGGIFLLSLLWFAHVIQRQRGLLMNCEPTAPAIVLNHNFAGDAAALILGGVLSASFNKGSIRNVSVSVFAKAMASPLDLACNMYSCTVL